MWIWVIAAIIAIVIDWCLASLAAGIAADKGYGEGTWKWICFFFGIIGYILVAAMPDLKTREELIRMRKNGQNLGGVNSGNLGTSSETEARSRPVPIVSVQYDAEGQWTCKKCGTRNSHDCTFCRDCGTYR